MKNVQVFSRLNSIAPTTQRGYTVFFGNWGTYYSEMTKEQLVSYYRTLIENSRHQCFGDLYIYLDGQLIRSVNWENSHNYIVTKSPN